MDEANETRPQFVWYRSDIDVIRCEPITVPPEKKEFPSYLQGYPGPNENTEKAQKKNSVHAIVPERSLQENEQLQKVTIIHPLLEHFAKFQNRSSKKKSSTNSTTSLERLLQRFGCA